jgi:hypothetical protein
MIPAVFPKRQVPLAAGKGFGTMRYQLLAAFAALAVAGSANAAVTTSFTQGGSSPSTGFTVIDTFNNLSGVTTNFGSVIVQSVNNGNGAPPANSNPLGTSYLSVLGGGSATINFAPSTTAFQFDWGSIDSYNTLKIYSSIGNITIIPGTSSFPNAANGNQSAPGTNGLFTVVGTAGETFSKIDLLSGTNSFEIDNLAVKTSGVVPEPATWAMLIAGFGLVGAAMRRQRLTPVRVSA